MSDRHVNHARRPWRRFPWHVLALLLGVAVVLGAAGVAPADDADVAEEAARRAMRAAGQAIGAAMAADEGRDDQATERRVSNRPLIAGQILQSDGTPLAEAKLQLHLNRYRRHGRGVYRDFRDKESITTDAEGRFEVDLHSTGQWRLSVRISGKGYAVSEKIKVVKGQANPPVVLTLAKGGRISGQVVDKTTGKPLAGVDVNGRFAGDNNENPFSSLETRSDDDGKWELADVPAGPWRLTSNQSQYVGADEIVDAKVGEDKTGVRLAMIPYVTVRGVVLGDDVRTPVAKARIRRQGDNSEITTDEKGRFSIVMPPTPGQKITVLSDEYAPVEHQITFTDDKAPPELWLILKTPGATICGTLADGETGKPIGNVTVLAIAVDKDQNRWGGGDWFMERLHDMRPGGRIGWGPFQKMIRTKADEFGAYQIRGLSAGKYYVCVPRKGAANLISKKITVAEGKIVAGIDLTAVKNPPGYLYGRILKPDGAPLANMHIRTQLRYNRGSYGSGTQTDDDGRFRLRLRGTGKTTLTITPSNYEPVKHTFQVADEKATLEIEFTLKPEKVRGSVSGRVVASDGKTGIEGLFVTPEWIGDRENSYSTAQAVQTDAEGKFHVKNLRPGKYVLNVSPRRNMRDRDEEVKKELVGLMPARSEEFTVPEGKETRDVTVTVTKGGTVDGKILDVKTGKPVPGARVSLSRRYSSGGLFGKRGPDEWAAMRWSSGGNLDAETDDEGRFKIEGVPAGKYQLTVSATGYQYKRMSGWKSLTVKPEKTVTRTVRLTPD